MKNDLGASAANASAAACPMPLLAPVTTATVPIMVVLQSLQSSGQA